MSSQPEYRPPIPIFQHTCRIAVAPIVAKQKPSLQLSAETETDSERRGRVCRPRGIVSADELHMARRSMKPRAVFVVLCGLQALAPPHVRAQAGDDTKLNEPTRPGNARPAEVQRRGVVQLELGSDTRVRSEDFWSEQAVPLGVRYVALPSLAFDMDVDVALSEVDRHSRVRHTGVGDVVVGAHWVALHEAPSHPAVAWAYDAKVPTAATDVDLGTGRVDHRLVVLLSKKVRALDVT
jgi:hypothetical protein